MRELLSEDPFKAGNNSVPWMDFSGPEDGKVVAITQRQLAFLVSNALMGNSIPVGDGLSAALARCASKGPPAPVDFIFSLLSFLAVLSQELPPNMHGTLLVATTPRSGEDAWKERLQNRTLQPPRVAEELMGGSDAMQGESYLAGRRLVAESGEEDFMAGGTPFQAITDIAGAVVGGGAELCATANSQDESLVQFYSEVLAFAFFTRRDTGMLPVPWTLLGARRYLGDLSGESSSGAPLWNRCGRISERDWLNDKIPTGRVSVTVAGLSRLMAPTAFVAVASDAPPLGGDCDVGRAMNHLCSAQRRNLDQKISQWYRAYEPTLYVEEVQDAVRGIVRRIGTGPWGAGVWFGDSQQYFLSVWLATSLLDQAPFLEYFLYDHFCENPGNQCFLLGEGGCADCIENAGVDGAPIHASRCGQQSVWGMIKHFQGRSAQELYDALSAVGGPPAQVFDLLKPGWKGPPAEEPQPPSPLVPRPSPAGAPHHHPWKIAAVGRELMREAGGKPHSPNRFTFAGFHTRHGAQTACGPRRLAMPKTGAAWREMQETIDRAIADGEMSPDNTVWLGAAWNPAQGAWQWDDGTEAADIRWAAGQPSAARGRQADEPYLCMLATGGWVHDANLGNPRFVFAAVCEAPDPDAGAHRVGGKLKFKL